MGTYYSQLARGFLFPSSQPVPASKCWESDQNCLQMPGRIAKLGSCNGIALAFQLHNKVAVSQNCPNMKRQVHWENLLYVSDTNHQPSKSSINVCQLSDLEMRRLISSCEQMLRATGSTERSCCPGLRPAQVDSIIQLTSITLQQPAVCLWKHNTGCYTRLRIQHLGSFSHFVSTRVQLILIPPRLLVCCQPCLLLIQSMVCLLSSWIIYAILT